MAVDYGDARTGLAVCDAGELLASPLKVIHQKNFERTAKEAAAAAKEAGAQLLVVGNPRNMDGSQGERSRICTEFAALLEELTGLPAVLWDERGTTVSAHRALNVTNTRGKKRKAVVDEVAAVIILDSYLAYRRSCGEQPPKA